MEYKVLRPFVDKESGVYFASGSLFSSEKETRVKELSSSGFVKVEDVTSTTRKKPPASTRKKASD